MGTRMAIQNISVGFKKSNEFNKFNDELIEIVQAKIKQLHSQGEKNLDSEHSYRIALSPFLTTEELSLISL